MIVSFNTIIEWLKLFNFLRLLSLLQTQVGLGIMQKSTLRLDFFHHFLTLSFSKYFALSLPLNVFGSVLLEVLNDFSNV